MRHASSMTDDAGTAAAAAAAADAARLSYDIRRFHKTALLAAQVATYVSRMCPKLSTPYMSVEIGNSAHITWVMRGAGCGMRACRQVGKKGRRDSRRTVRTNYVVTKNHATYNNPPGISGTCYVSHTQGMNTFCFFSIPESRQLRWRTWYHPHPVQHTVWYTRYTWRSLI